MSLLPKTRIRELADRSKFPDPDPVFSPPRVANLKAQIALGLPVTRMRQKWNAILAVPRDYVIQGPVDPWYVPPYYDDPNANDAVTAIITADGSAAVDLALRWRILNHPDDAKAAARILEAWAVQTPYNVTGDSRLVWSNRWPMFIEAAQLISNSPYYTLALEESMKAVTSTRMTLSSAFAQTENRAVWGCLLEVSAGAYLGDRRRFDGGIARWRELFNHDIVANVPVGEVARGSNSLYYCNFLLNAMTQVAEIARFNGEWLYDYVSPNGSSFKGLWDNVSMWTADPSTFTYWPGSNTVRIQAHVDPLHALWPNSYSQTLIDTYTTTQDYFGYRQGLLAYRGQELYD